MSSNLDSLKRAIQIAEQIDALQAELNQVLASVGTGNAVSIAPAVAAAPKAGKPGRRKGQMSAAGRAAIIAAQKARWAKVKAAKGGAAPAAKADAAPATRGGKRKFSAAARAKMAAAARARWARQKGK